MNQNKNIETFLGCAAEYADASLALFGAPFDGTASYRPGARFAPKAMRSESHGLETYSPYQDRDLASLSVFDGGDLELPYGNPKKALSMIESYVSLLLKDGKTPVMLGGEHLVTLGAIKAVAKMTPGLVVLHLDAHTDLRDEYSGEKLSHATVMRRVWELVGDGKLIQFGVRSGEKHEFDFAREHAELHAFGLRGWDDVMDRLAGRPVYVSLDLDILDPSVLPGTGTPEPGGVGFSELLEAIVRLDRLRVVGCDVTELSPNYDQSGVSTAAACKILRELLLAIGN